MQRANIQRYNSVVTPGSVGDTSAAQRYSVPYETQNLQQNMMRHHSGPPPLYEGREINIPWNGISGQDRSIRGMNQAAGEGILPGER